MISPCGVVLTHILAQGGPGNQMKHGKVGGKPLGNDHFTSANRAFQVGLPDAVSFRMTRSPLRIIECELNEERNNFKGKMTGIWNTMRSAWEHAREAAYAVR